MEALLALADGTIFAGRSFGAPGERAGEVVFDTSMTGYQEVLTDPSYRGQMVAMTAPHIGNTGINEEDLETERPHMEALLVRDLSPIASNWRAQKDLGHFLREHGVFALTEVDTRALTRHLRAVGAVKAVASTEDLDPASLVAKAQAAPTIPERRLVPEVSCREPFEWTAGSPPEWRAGEVEPFPVRRQVAVLDCGVKRSILRHLVDVGCRVTVVPWNTSAADILGLGADGVVVSSGPGDPAQVMEAVETVRELVRRRPILGIALGHQILALALGARIHKLHLGHHGSQPVIDCASGRVQITAQNHTFAVDSAALEGLGVEVTHINLNDRTVEGLRHPRWPAVGVQFHPEGRPGPHDGQGLLREFLQLVDARRQTPR